MEHKRGLLMLIDLLRRIVLFFRSLFDEWTDTTPIPPKPIDTPPIKVHEQKYLWILDNGHGSLTNGKRSPKFEDGSRFFEYKFNRIIVNGIAEELDKLGIAYHILVPEIEIGDFLKGRVDRANEIVSDIPSIYLSVHSNAFGNGWQDVAKGAEVWHIKNNPFTKELSQVFQNELVNIGFKDRGVKSRNKNSFYVLRKTNMPAILTESGFFNHTEEVHKLLDRNFQQQIINAHVRAIKNTELMG